MEISSSLLQWRIQDFPDERAPTSKVLAPSYYLVILFFRLNCMKIKEIGRSQSEVFLVGSYFVRHSRVAPGNRTRSNQTFVSGCS